MSTEWMDIPCSFCSKAHREVAFMIAGPRAYICDRDTLEAERRRGKPKSRQAPNSGKSLPPLPKSC